MVSRTFWLNFHLPYRCRHSLACCSSGWPIPIERGRAAGIARDIAAGRVHPLKTPWLIDEPEAPAEVAGTLAFGSGGHCVFLNDRRATSIGCAIYPSRPVSCVHFPYVCLIDQRGVRVTLSHYCPTAASLLFEHEGPIAIVEGPSPIAEFDVPEGLDAREALPPLASPGRLMTFDEFSAWERDAVQGIGAKGAKGAREVLSWFEAARHAVPAPLSWPEIPEAIDRVWGDLVAPAWESFAPVIDRYLAAKLFASWHAYLGDGTDAVLRGVAVAESVLRVECARQCAAAHRALDAALLKAAIRQSDLLLVHYAKWP